MAERKAVNKYYPPDFDPAVHGTLNAYHGRHPLGNRARKLRTEGAVIVRFEMPFNAWCDLCHTLLARGTRFNAAQQGAGRYHSTRVYRFTMRCPCCGCQFALETDPAHADYRAVSGATRKTEDWAQASSEGPALADPAARARLHTDVLCRLEHEQADAARAQAQRRTLVAAARAQNATARDDYAANAAARRIMRAARAREHAQQRDARALGLAPSLVPRLAPATARDEALVRAAHTARQEAQAARQQRVQVLAAACSDAFAPPSPATLRALAVVAEAHKPPPAKRPCTHLSIFSPQL